MNKRVHFNTPNHIHELTFSCYHRRPFLNDPNHGQLLVEAIDRSKEKLEFSLLGYVFMPNHIHLLILPLRQKYQISLILKSIKQSVSRSVMILTRKTNPNSLDSFKTKSKSKPFRFWQPGGGYDRNIISQVALRKSIDYIHNNPVKAGLVQSPDEWEWSSFKDWANLGHGPIAVDLEAMPFVK
ncbi:MAG: transposase [bacterium]|nr:transposase [bacterium]